MRLRTDSAHLAGWHRALNLGALVQKPGEDWRDTLAAPPAEPGDVWRLHVGYALTCPKTDCTAGVHYWDHAWNCPRRYERDAPSCWQWSGSPEDGTLSATPSLHVLAERGGCGWHGWLRNGQMVLA